VTPLSTKRPGSPGYQVYVLALSIFALVAIALQASPRLDDESRAILEYADWGVCALFFVDFLVCFARAPSKLRYMATWGWLDLVSCIPAIDHFRWLGSARIVRILRVLRAVRASRLIAQLIIDRRGESAILAAWLGVLVLIVVASVSVLYFEVEPGSNIRSAEDAIWWTFTTITGVGYGDRFPVTHEGRAIGVLLMMAGVGLVGILSGLFAAWFLAPAVAEEERGDAALRDEVAALRASVDALRDEVRSATRAR
jgi:voltage-gated potassium channel